MNRILKGLSYTFKRNIGTTDRLLRVAFFLIVAVSWYFGIIAGTIATVLGVFATMLLGTAAVSRCSLTYMFDGNTMSDADKKRLDEKGITYE